MENLTASLFRESQRAVSYIGDCLKTNVLETCSVPVIHPGDNRNRADLRSTGIADCLGVF